MVGSKKKEVWVKNDTNPAHKLLNQKFLNGEITSATKVLELYNSNELFQKFSQQVFRNNFTLLKAAHGIDRKLVFSLSFFKNKLIIVNISVEKPPVDDGQNGAVAGQNGTVAGGSGLKLSSGIKRTRDEEGDDDDHDSQVKHRNQPVLMSVYLDPVTEQEKVIVVASLPGGTEEAKFSLVGLGPGTKTARIVYHWPKISFQFDELFAKQIKADKITNYHPKIVALKKDLQLNRERIDQNPTGSMELTLPISVQTAESSILRYGVRQQNDGSRVLIAELTAYQSMYTVKEEEDAVKFEES